MKGHWTVTLYTKTTTTTTTCRLHHCKILYKYEWMNKYEQIKMNLWFLSILIKRSISGGSRLHHCKISSIYAAILNLIFLQYFGIPACRTSSVICVPNFVQICAIVNELWKINEIQNGGRRHLEFIIFVHFGQMVYFWSQPVTSLQNFIHLRQSAAELLMFVQKSWI